jgi:hypothetical protein
MDDFFIESNEDHQQYVKTDGMDLNVSDILYKTLPTNIQEPKR